MNKLHVTVDTSAVQAEIDKVLAVLMDVRESIGLVIDHLDAGVHASQSPWSAELHVVGMRGVMQQAMEDLRAVIGSKEVT